QVRSRCYASTIAWRSRKPWQFWQGLKPGSMPRQISGSGYAGASIQSDDGGSSKSLQPAKGADGVVAVRQGMAVGLREADIAAGIASGARRPVKAAGTALMSGRAGLRGDGDYNGGVGRAFFSRRLLPIAACQGVFFCPP